MNSAPCEGIYYVVRFPTRWEIVVYRFEGGKDNNHYEWWEQSASEVVAAKWATALVKTIDAIRQEIELLPYAFPRGRVSKVGKRFLVFQGGDLTQPMQISQKAIEGAFGISGRCTWKFDEHEQCQAEDKQAIQKYLGITEDWKAV